MFLYDSKIQLGLVKILVKLMKNSFGQNPDIIRAKLRVFNDVFLLTIKNTTKKTKVALTFKINQPDSFRAVCYERETNTAFNLTKDYVEYETIIFSKNPAPKEILEKITPALLRKSKYISWIENGNFSHIKATAKNPDSLYENEVFAGKIINTVIDKVNQLFHLTCQIGEKSNNEIKVFILSHKEIPYINKYIHNKTLNNQFLVINRRMEHAIFNDLTFKELFKFS